MFRGAAAAATDKLFYFRPFSLETRINTTLIYWSARGNKENATKLLQMNIDPAEGLRLPLWVLLLRQLDAHSEVLTNVQEYHKKGKQQYLSRVSSSMQESGSLQSLGSDSLKEEDEEDEEDEDELSAYLLLLDDAEVLEGLRASASASNDSFLGRADPLKASFVLQLVKSSETCACYMHDDVVFHATRLLSAYL